MREFTLGAAAAEEADAAPPAADSSPPLPDVLLLVFDPVLFVLSLLFRFPLLEVVVVGGGVAGGNFLTRSIRLNRDLQQGHLFSVSAHYKYIIVMI